MEVRREIIVKINSEITKTEQIIKDLKEQTAPISPDCAIGRISRMDAINNKSVVEASLRQAENKLISLNRVKDNIDSADFGFCLKCRQPIPIGRILYRPESLYCVNCAK